MKEVIPCPRERHIFPERCPSLHAFAGERELGGATWETRLSEAVGAEAKSRSVVA